MMNQVMIIEDLIEMDMIVTGLMLMALIVQDIAQLAIIDRGKTKKGSTIDFMT